MAKILSRRKVEWVPEYARDFESLLHPGSGYQFECDKDGKPLDPEHVARIAYLCADRNYVDNGIKEWQKKQVTPGKVLCHCGRVNDLWGGGDFTCECGQWFNTFGQELRHPRYWGEETGERFDDNGNYIGGGEY